MTDAVAEQVAATEEITRPDPEQPVAEAADPARMFKFSDWVHVGEGAEKCEKAGQDRCQHIAEPGVKAVNLAERCEDPEHFHAYCRLPNKFQHKDLRDRALAAKARLLRALRDPDSDAHAVLEGDLAELRHVEDDLLIDEILAQDWSKDYMESIRVVEEEERFENATHDRERFRELTKEWENKPEDEWPEELTLLSKHIATYIDAVSEKAKEIQEPKREALRAKGIDGLIEMIRDLRAELSGDQEFQEIYARWLWFIGTLNVMPDPVMGRPNTRRFESMDQMLDQSPEVVDELKLTFNALELALQRGSVGNF